MYIFLYLFIEIHITRKTDTCGLFLPDFCITFFVVDATVRVQRNLDTIASSISIKYILSRSPEGKPQDKFPPLHKRNLNLPVLIRLVLYLVKKTSTFKNCRTLISN